MSDIATTILQNCEAEWNSGLLELSRQRVRQYIETLAATGTNDPKDLLEYGLAYLKELETPDPRYTGC